MKKFYMKNNTLFASFAIIVALFVIGAVMSPGFASYSHILMILKTSAFLGMIALAQTIVIVVGGEGLDLSVGAMASAGAIMASVVLGYTNTPTAFLLVIATGFLLGLINGIGISYFKVAPLIMTLAMSSVISGMIIIHSNGFALKGSASDWLKTVSGGSSFGIPNIVIVWVFIIVISLIFLFRTRTGFQLYAVGANEMTAELNGIRTKRLRAVAYGMSGAISAMSGLFLLGYIGNAFLDMGSIYVLPSIAAVVIGGVSLAGGSGNYLGAVFGSIVLTTLTAILVTLKIGEAGKQVIFGVLLLVLLALYGRKNRSES